MKIWYPLSNNIYNWKWKLNLLCKALCGEFPSADPQPIFEINEVWFFPLYPRFILFLASCCNIFISTNLIFIKSLHLLQVSALHLLLPNFWFLALELIYRERSNMNQAQFSSSLFYLFKANKEVKIYWTVFILYYHYFTNVVLCHNVP